MNRYLTVQEFASATGYTNQAITRWCRNGRLDAIQPAGRGGSWRINPKELKNGRKKEEAPDP